MNVNVYASVKSSLPLPASIPRICGASSLSFFMLVWMMVSPMAHSSAAPSLAEGIGSGRGYGRNDRDLRSALARLYLQRLEGYGFSGSMLVARAGNVVLETHHGLADRGHNVPFSSETIFDVGSITKQFTAVAILALEADGKLSVSDPINKYLQNVPPDKQAITLHHLLTHTSGLAMGFGGDYEKLTRDEFVARAMRSELQSPPGRVHAYSNAGFGLLAAIVERVAGKRHDEFIRERLFLPLGMTSSGYYILSPEKAGRVARGYSGGKDLNLPEEAAATGGEMWNLLGNGGMLSTVRDLHIWGIALRTGKVLTADARDKLFRPQALVRENYRGSGTPLHYGYGWYIWKQPSGKTLVWHHGGNEITNAALRMHGDDDMVVIYASNTAEFHEPRGPVPAVERILAGEPVSLPPEVVPWSKERLSELQGVYTASGAQAKLSVFAGDGRLSLQGAGQAAFAFVTADEWLSTPQLNSLNVKIADLVENSRTGKYEPMIPLYGIPTTPVQLGEFERSFWKRRFDRHGGFVRTRVLGTVDLKNSRFAHRTVVAVDFERGSTYREYLWTAEGKIGDLGPLDGPPASVYFPTSNSCFAKFDASAAIVTSSICFSKGGMTARRGNTSVALKRSTAH